jgi:hypothetical protein
LLSVTIAPEKKKSISAQDEEELDETDAGLSVLIDGITQELEINRRATLHIHRETPSRDATTTSNNDNDSDDDNDSSTPAIVAIISPHQRSRSMALPPSSTGIVSHKESSLALSTPSASALTLPSLACPIPESTVDPKHEAHSTRVTGPSSTSSSTVAATLLPSSNQASASILPASLSVAAAALAARHAAQRAREDNSWYEIPGGSSVTSSTSISSTTFIRHDTKTKVVSTNSSSSSGVHHATGGGQAKRPHSLGTPSSRAPILKKKPTLRTKEGYLSKKSPALFTGWQRRWFYLFEHSLYYYRGRIDTYLTCSLS